MTKTTQVSTSKDQPAHVIVPVDESEMYNVMFVGLMYDDHFKHMVAQYQQSMVAMEKSVDQVRREQSTRELESSMRLLSDQIQYFRGLYTEEVRSEQQQHDFNELQKNIPSGLSNVHQAANRLYQSYFPDEPPPFDYKQNELLARQEVHSLYYDGAGLGKQGDVPSHVACVITGMLH
jgi:hypothetical protein